MLSIKYKEQCGVELAKFYWKFHKFELKQL